MLILGRGWRERAIIETRGNQTELGAVLIAVLGKAPDNPPRIVGLGRITKDGLLIASFQHKDGHVTFWNVNRPWLDDEGKQPNPRYVAGENPVCFGKVGDVTDAFRRLADRLQLSDAERVEMLGEFRKWIAKDDREHHEL